MSGATSTGSPYLDAVVGQWRGLVEIYHRGSTQGKIGFWMMVGLVLMAVFAPVIAPHDPYFQNYDSLHAAPSMEYPMGTDHIGRDVMSRVIFGSRVSLAVAALAVAWSAAVGVIWGSVSGYRGGWTDDVLMRLADAVMAFPGIVLAIALVAVLPPSIPTLAFALGVGASASYARLIRSEILSLKEEAFIEAVEGLGMKERDILLKEILPNSFQPVLVQMTFNFPLAILGEAGLSFLGLGIQSPTASWGRMIQLNQSHMPEVWWPVIFPGLAIFITVMGFNLMGDDLQDEWDPYTEEL